MADRFLGVGYFLISSLVLSSPVSFYREKVMISQIMWVGERGFSSFGVKGTVMKFVNNLWGQGTSRNRILVPARKAFGDWGCGGGSVSRVVRVDVWWIIVYTVLYEGACFLEVLHTSPKWFGDWDGWVGGGGESNFSLVYEASLVWASRICVQ